MPIKNPFRSLKTRVAAIVSAVSLVSLWGVVLIISNWQLTDLRSTLGNQQLTVAKVLADQLIDRFGVRIQALEAVAATVTPQIWSSPVRLQQLLDERLALYTLFNAGAFITGADGIATASHPREAGRTGVDYSNRNHVQTALKTGTASVGDLVMSATIHKPVLSMAVPIRDGEGKVIGSLVGVNDLTVHNFLDAIVDNALGESGGYLLVSRKQRLIVTGTDRSRILEQLPPLGVNPAIDAFLDGKDGWTVLVNPKGVEVLVAVQQIPSAGWYLAATTPTAEAFRPITVLLTRMGWLVLAVTVLAGAMNWLVLRYELTPVVRAIQILSASSTTAHPLQPLPLSGSGEIRDLIASFNHLIQTIEKQEEEKGRYESLLANRQRIEAIGVLAGGIAHDFNNLLAGIFGNIELALLIDAQSPGSTYLKKTLETLNRARGLTKQLMTFSKGADLQLQTGPLFPFVEETARFALAGSNVELRLEVASDLWLCRFDQGQLGQALDNLVINARQAMPEGGRITLRAANRNDGNAVRWIRLEVEDNGPGLAPEAQAHLFEPFFSTKAAGHGLGLATAFSIVVKHGGSLEVSSRPAGGTAFVMTLPAAEGEADTPAGEPTLPLVPGTILIMDDEDAVADVLVEMLHLLGYQVIRTRSGHEAVEVFLQDRDGPAAISAVILDLTVPGGMGGREALERMHARDPRLPALVASGFSEEPILTNPTAYGFTAVLHKPYLRSDLERALGRLQNS